MLIGNNMRFFIKLFQSTGKRFRYLIVRPSLYPFFKALFYFSLKGIGVLNFENSKLSGENNFINNILKNIIGDKDNYLFIDIGANVGNYSQLLAEKFPCAEIYSFEPHPGNYKRLSSINNEKLHTFNIALGNENKEIELFDIADSNGTELASIYYDVISEIHKKNANSFSVNMYKLSDLCKDKNISFIDFMKIDTEGSELSVLEGARELIINNAIKCIHFEFNEMNVISKVFMRDFVNALHGFELYRLLPKGMIKLEETPVLSEIFAYQNIIAINKN